MEPFPISSILHSNPSPSPYLTPHETNEEKQHQQQLNTLIFDKRMVQQLLRCGTLLMVKRQTCLDK